LPSAFFLLPSAAAQAPQTPIIVKIVETPGDPTGLAGVMIGAFGLTGVLLLMALALGAVIGGILFFARRHHPLS
jgi:hypothetical protein